MASSSSSTTVSQLSCFSSITSNKLQRHRRYALSPPSPRKKPWLVMSVEPRSTNTSPSDSSEASQTRGILDPPHPTVVEADAADDGVKVYGAAKIHDFCFGIPYGSLVLSGGFLGFIFSRNPTTLGAGVLFGGALLALSTFSLKVWRQGKSSLPFVLGQAALSAALLWKNFQSYLLTKKLIPTGFFAVISAAMLCFYLHVMISGGNPPPKKLQSAATVAS